MAHDMQALFFKGRQYAVLGASTDSTKYGHKVLKLYIAQETLPVTPVHPKEQSILGRKTVREVGDIPLSPQIEGSNAHDISVSIITPPPITLSFLKSIFGQGSSGDRRVGMVWCQPGAEDKAVADLVREAGLENKVIMGGPCILVNGAEARRRSAKL